MSVSRSEYNHALKVFTELKCVSLGDYHDLYLTTDVLLLASVFEAFREVCYQTYGLDCACYFTASNLSGDAFLKVCKPELKLLTDREHLDLVQRMIRGGADFTKQTINTSTIFRPQNHQATSSILMQTICTGG